MTQIIEIATNEKAPLWDEPTWELFRSDANMLAGCVAEVKRL
mgnify:CR=1 FL=1